MFGYRWLHCQVFTGGVRSIAGWRIWDMKEGKFGCPATPMYMCRMHLAKSKTTIMVPVVLATSVTLCSKVTRKSDDVKPKYSSVVNLVLTASLSVNDLLSSGNGIKR